MILKNCTFFGEFFEKEFGDIEIQNGIISRLGILPEGRDMSGCIIVPGFIDIHIHGANGGDTCDARIDSLDRMSSYLAKNGVTSFCPTAMTMPSERLKEIVKTIKEYNAGKAKVVGINLEGPYISEKKKGSQNPDYIRGASTEEFSELYGLSGGLIKLITVAPEIEGNAKFIKSVSDKCTVSLGHSAANEAQTREALNLGARHITHLFNAMSPMTHRSAGLAGTALDDERVMCELICDLSHICPTVLRNAFDILGDNRAVVVSDSMRAAGLGASEFDLGGQSVFVREGGKYAELQDGTIGASITNIHEEFKNLVNIGIDFKTALRACTINPARAIGMENEIGSIAVGKRADLLVLDENLEIKEVYINGILA